MIFFFSGLPLALTSIYTRDFGGGTKEFKIISYKGKHDKDANLGWYRYYTKFALPVFDDNGEIERYNVFNVVMVVRHNQDGKLYLYDIMNIKKKRAPFSSPKTLLSKKPISCP